MRAENIRLTQAGDQLLSVVSEDPALFRLVNLREGVEAPDGSPPVGFKISKPASSRGLWTVIGADGAILARSKKPETAVRILNRHLAALDSASPRARADRFAFRAVIGPSGDAVLVDPALLRSQPVLERVYSKIGMRVVDAPFVDVIVDEHPTRLVPVGPKRVDATRGPAGHIDPASLRSPNVRAVLWGAQPEAAEPSPGQIVQALASKTRIGMRQTRLDAGSRLASSVPVRLVQIKEKRALVKALAAAFSGRL